MRYFLTFIIAFLTFTSYAQKGYEIKVHLDNYDQEELYLGYYLGNNQYIKDTVTLNKKHEFVFKSDEDSLARGVYLVIMAPDNNYFELLINDKHPKIDISTDVNSTYKSMKFKHSKDNMVYYDYINEFGVVRTEVEKLKSELAKFEEGDSEFSRINDEIEKAKKRIDEKREKMIVDNPDFLSSLLFKSNTNLEFPDFEGSEEEKSMQKYLFAKKHYFDYLNLDDPRMLRTPILFQRLEYYVEKMTPQHPDSICIALDRILNLLEPAPDSYQYYLIHYINKYANAKFVGFDAIYVYLAENYYEKGKAPWTSEETLLKIKKQADTWKPILIGKIAPDIKLQTKDGKPFSLYEMTSDYTVLFFWSPDCGHCKKEMPDMIKFQEDFRDKGVEIFSVCTMISDKVPKCWDFIDERESMGTWINLVDPYLQSRYKQIYDVRATPSIFVINNKTHEIISKRIGVKQLSEVMERLMEIEKEKEKEMLMEIDKMKSDN